MNFPMVINMALSGYAIAGAGTLPLLSINVIMDASKVPLLPFAILIGSLAQPSKPISKSHVAHATAPEA